MTRTVARVFGLALGLGLGLGGCSQKKPDDGTAPASAKALPPLTIRDDTPDLLLTWIDDKGNTHVELKPSDVPAAGRGFVRVVVSDRDEGTHELFYVADLSKPREDGSFATQTVRRSEWEAALENKRRAFLTPPAPPPGDTGSAPGAPGAAADAKTPTVIIYGAAWCGPCHQAADYLKSKRVAYVMKDVETTPGAAGEMQAKLARVGRHGGSIPVLDVGGQILVGFSAGSVDQALAIAARGANL